MKKNLFDFVPLLNLDTVFGYSISAVCLYLTNLASWNIITMTFERPQIHFIANDGLATLAVMVSYSKLAFFPLQNYALPAIKAKSPLIACSLTLYFLFEVRRVRVIKNKNRGGFIDRQKKETKRKIKRLCTG